MAGWDGDKWVTEVTDLLLTEFDGRAKFGKFRRMLYQRNLVKCGISRVLKRLSSSSRFLVFEKDGHVKHVSVCWEDVDICCGYRKKGWDTCQKYNCPKFHVCKFFIAGNCTKGSKCLFGHDLENETNENVSSRLGMSSFSADEIRTIIFRSKPAVCVRHNTGGCQDEHCPDLHVCGLFAQNKCTSGYNCQFGHVLQSSEHNQWVLSTFDLEDFTDEELRKVILVRGVSTADRGLLSQMTPAISSLSLVSCTTAASSTSIETEDTDEYVFSVFSFLLKRYGGRTKFDTFLSDRGHLLSGFKRADIIEWFQNYNDRFLVYENDGDLTYVSAYSKRARVCFKYNDPGGSICGNLSCQFFHICRQFIAGTCASTRCRLSHSFWSGPNAKICSDLNLDQFTDMDICKLILCSNPAVCVNYNTSGCRRNDCPDLHICSKYILKMCSSGDGCRFGHTIEDSGEHNQYVLEAFQMGTWRENALCKIVMVKKGEPREVLQSSRQRAYSNVPSVPGSRGADVADVADFLKPVKFTDSNPGKYQNLCEMYTWTGICPKASQCACYHGPVRLPYLWLLQDQAGAWFSLSSSDSADFEKIFCGLYDLRYLQFTIPGYLSIDFNAMSATVEKMGKMQSVTLKRLSTPSYVDAVPGVPLHFYTQWLWYRQERDGTYSPFYPGELQYTLEKKYLKKQHTYYFEFEDFRLKINTQGSSMVQENLDTHRSAQIVRRPVFVNSKQSAVSVMSPLLLCDVPEPLPHTVPDHWSSVDHFQDFEVVEVTSGEVEYADVHRQFFSTMNARKHNIEHIFRVQNPGLWDKYCSARRAMTSRGQKPEDVKERQLFHGTPTLQSARGICANTFDFRRAGENVGAIYGKGAYFSTTAHYSHSYTRPHTRPRGRPLRFMFLAKILVGQYTLGQPSYNKPPERDRLKMYDSCVNDMSSPTIFVIFDLVQSYPEYLIEYTDSSDVSDTNSKPPPQPRPQAQAPTATARSHAQASPTAAVAATTASTTVSTLAFSTSTSPSSAAANQTTASLHPSLPQPFAVPPAVPHAPNKQPASGAAQQVSQSSYSPSLANTGTPQPLVSLAPGHVDIGLSASCTNISSNNPSSCAAPLSAKQGPSSSHKQKGKKHSKHCTVC